MGNMIKHKQRAKQVIEFSNMIIEIPEGQVDIHPTDIDAVIDWKSKGFIFTEYKYKDAEFPKGQELMYERLCDNLKIPAITILASHDTPATEMVDGGKAKVLRVYFNHEWHLPCTEMNVEECIKMFIDKVGKNPRKLN